MNIVICDYCGEKGMAKLAMIKLTRRPNDETTYAELCKVCLGDIAQYLTAQPQEEE